MGHNDIFLKLHTVFFGYDYITEFAETGGDTIYDLLPFYKIVNDLSGSTDALHGLFVQFYGSMKTADCCQFIQG